MTHPAATTFGLFEDETYPHQGVSAGQLLNHDDYDKRRARRFWFKPMDDWACH